MKHYVVECLAILSTCTDAQTKKEARELAKNEFAGFLRFLDKTSDGPFVHCKIAPLKVTLVNHS